MTLEELDEKRDREYQRSAPLLHRPRHRMKGTLMYDNDDRPTRSELAAEDPAYQRELRHRTTLLELATEDDWSAVADHAAMCPYVDARVSAVLTSIATAALGEL